MKTISDQVKIIHNKKEMYNFTNIQNLKTEKQN